MGEAHRSSIPLPPLKWKSCGSAHADRVGRVAEWLKAHDWKSCGLTPAWVRIPPRPLFDAN